MANSMAHAHIYPIKGARFTMLVPYLDADGDPLDPTTPDTEVSIQGGAFADATEEVTTITGSNGVGYITLTGAETNGNLVAVAFKVASGPKATLILLQPRELMVISSGTLSAGSAGGGTLNPILPYDITGCFIRSTGGTGGGGTGGANNQASRIDSYDRSTGVFTCANLEVAWDSTTTYRVLLPEGMTLGVLKTLNPTSEGRTLDVSAAGEAGLDWANIGAPTTTQGLSGTTIKNTTDVNAKLPAALVGGRMDSSVGAMAANVLTATAINADAITAAKVADGTIDAATFAAGAINAAAIAADAITAAKIAADAIGASELAADAATEIATAVWAATTRTLTALGFTLAAADLASGIITAAKFSAGAIDAAAIAADAIGASELAADAVTEINAGILAVLGALADAAADGDPTSTDTLMAYTKQLINTLVGTAGIVAWPASAAPGNAVSMAEALRAIYDDTNAIPDSGALTTIQADLDDLQTRVPAALVGGRMDSSVGAMAAAVLTATAIATDAITAAKIAADAIGASELAADAVTEIQAGLALASALATAQTAITDLQARIPAALVSGRIDSSVGAMAANVVTASAINADAIGASELAADAVAEIADAIWDEARSGHVATGSFGQGSQVLHCALAQGGDATHVQLATSASAVDDQYNGLLVAIVGGTGKGQNRMIPLGAGSYVGATRQALVDAWDVVPDATSLVIIVGY